MAGIRTKAWGQQKPALGSRLMRGHPLAQGIIDAWLFNEAGGTPRSLNGRGPTTLSNGPVWTPSPQGQSIKFASASSQYATVGDIVEARNNTSLTVLAWASPTTLIGSGRSSIVSKADNPRYEWELYMQDWLLGSGGGPSFAYFTTAGGAFYSRAFSASGPLVAGQWYQVVGTFDTATGATQVFLNGKLFASNATTFDVKNASVGANITFARRDDGVLYLDGSISQVAMWKRVLGASEVAWLYAEPHAFIAPPGPRRSYSAAGGGTGVTVSSSTVAGTFSTVTPSVAGGASVSPATQAATFSTVTAAITGGAAVAAATQAASFAVVSPTVTATGDAVANVATQAAVFSVVSPSVSGSAAVSAGTAAASFSVVSPTIDTSGNVTATAATQSVAFVTVTPTITTVRHTSFSASALTATFSIILPTVTAGAFEPEPEPQPDPVPPPVVTVRGRALTVAFEASARGMRVAEEPIARPLTVNKERS